MRIKKARRELSLDIAFVFLGAVLALALSQFGAIDWLVNIFGSQIFASFFAGIFFTSVFTVAPSSVALVSIKDASIITISTWGALGALCGDLILFFFIKDRFAKDLMSSIRPSVIKRILNSFHLGFMKYLSPFLGALIIASPLPDELGLTLLGISKVRIFVLIPIAFIMNFIGIYLLLHFAQLI